MAAASLTLCRLQPSSSDTGRSALVGTGEQEILTKQTSGYMKQIVW